MYGPHVGIPVVAELRQRTGAVERIGLHPDAGEDQIDPDVDGAQEDGADLGVEGYQIGRRGRGVAEQLEEFEVGVDGQLEVLEADGGTGGPPGRKAHSTGHRVTRRRGGAIRIAKRHAGR